MYLATIINCGWDFAESFLKHSYAGIDRSIDVAPKDDNWESKGVMREFSQTEFVDRKIWQWNGLDDTGYVFYPTQCLVKNAKCKVHVNLHGCGQNYRYTYLALPKYSGFNEYAVTNDIIVLYPQTRGSWWYNPSSCWDIGI